MTYEELAFKEAILTEINKLRLKGNVLQAGIAIESQPILDMCLELEILKIKIEEIFK